MSIDVEEVYLSDIQDYAERTFHPLAQKGLDFTIEIGADVPGTIRTDRNRLQQILRNLLSNATKFTKTGSVTTQIEIATEGWSREVETLNQADKVIAFNIIDTGIGIPENKRRIIFEAFQQPQGRPPRKRRKEFCNSRKAVEFALYRYPECSTVTRRDRFIPH